jgi:hypothetical protein
MPKENRGDDTTKGKYERAKLTIKTFIEGIKCVESNAITSIIHNALTKHDFAANTQKVQLFADGCGGQNKNSPMMPMLAYWLRYIAPDQIKSLEFTFPVVGHSFLPSDRVFGLIEEKLRKQNRVNALVNRPPPIIGHFYVRM